MSLCVCWSLSIVSSLGIFLCVCVCLQEPFYGNPADKPPRPTVFAGREFRVPSVDDVPPFLPWLPPGPDDLGEDHPHHEVLGGGRAGSGQRPHIASLRALVMSARQPPPPAFTEALTLGPGRRRGLAFALAHKPPPPPEVDAWVRRQGYGGRRRCLTAPGRGAPTPATAGISTGALLPAGEPGESAYAAMLSPAATPRGSLGEEMGGSLLATPVLVLSSEPASSPSPGREWVPPADSGWAPVDTKADAVQPGRDDGHGSPAAEGLDASDGIYSVDGVPIARPASPKYDGRSFFFAGGTTALPRGEALAGEAGRGGRGGQEPHGWWLRPGVVSAAPSQQALARQGEHLQLQPSASQLHVAGGTASVATPSEAQSTPDGAGRQPPPLLAPHNRPAAIPGCGHTSTTPASVFKGTATIRSPGGGAGHPFSMISPVGPNSGQPTATPASQR